jgi:hypothetical protein
MPHSSRSGNIFYSQTVSSISAVIICISHILEILSLIGSEVYLQLMNLLRNFNYVAIFRVVKGLLAVWLQWHIKLLCQCIQCPGHMHCLLNAHLSILHGSPCTIPLTSTPTYSILSVLAWTLLTAHQLSQSSEMKPCATASPSDCSPGLPLSLGMTAAWRMSSQDWPSS